MRLILAVIKSEYKYTGVTKLKRINYTCACTRLHVTLPSSVVGLRLLHSCELKGLPCRRPLRMRRVLHSVHWSAHAAVGIYLPFGVGLTTFQGRSVTRVFYFYDI